MIRYIKIFIITSIFAAFGCTKESHLEVSDSCTGELVISKSKAFAGEKIDIAIPSSLACKQLLKLGVSDFWGENIYLLEDTIFTIPQVISNKKGIKTLTLYSGNKILDTASIEISAIEANGVLESFYGPKTIPADKDQHFMFITIPRDKYNNPVDDGSIVDYQLMFPDQTQKLHKATKNLITYSIANNDHPAGKIYAGMSTTGSHSRETEVFITGGWPASFEINVVQHYPYADSRQFYYVETERITDVDGNVINDGTNVYFNLYVDNNLVGKYKTYTINGKATVKIQNPDRAIKIEIEASIGHIATSDRKVLSFNSAVAQYDITWNKNENKILIGPVLGDLDQLISDGFIFEYHIRGNEVGFSRKSEINNGKFEYDLDNLILDEGEYSFVVNISGLQKSINFKVF